MPRPSPQTDRVVAVLNLLAETNGAGTTLTEIARRIGANRASCVHMLAALEGAGYLVRDPTDLRYHLGPALITLGSTASRRYPGFEATRHEIDDLTRATGYPCFAFARERDRARLLYYTWDLRRPAPAMQVGDMITIVPPLGAVFFAWGDERAVDDWVEQAPGGKQHGEQLRETLAAVRTLGYVVELQPPNAMFHELLGDRRAPDGSRLPLGVYDPKDFVLNEIDDHQEYTVSSISVPVLDADERTVIALNLAGFAAPVAGTEIRRLAAMARAAAARAMIAR